MNYWILTSGKLSGTVRGCRCQLASTYQSLSAESYTLTLHLVAWQTNEQVWISRVIPTSCLLWCNKSSVKTFTRNAVCFAFGIWNPQKYLCKIMKITTLKMLIIFPGEWNGDTGCFGLIVKCFTDNYCAHRKNWHWHQYFLLFCSRALIHVNLEFRVNNRTHHS